MFYHYTDVMEWSMTPRIECRQGPFPDEK